MVPEFVVIVLLVALALGAIGVGGAIYETLLVDPVWPGNPALIQPSRGGLDRKRFWAPIHALFEVALLGSAWMAWREPAARPWIVLALSAHFGARVWSFAYFIPLALRFEKRGDLSVEEVRLARRWTRLSPCRSLIELVAIAALGVLVVHLGRG